MYSDGMYSAIPCEQSVGLGERYRTAALQVVRRYRTPLLNCSDSTLQPSPTRKSPAYSPGHSTDESARSVSSLAIRRLAVAESCGIQPLPHPSIYTQCVSYREGSPLCPFSRVRIHDATTP